MEKLIFIVSGLLAVIVVYNIFFKKTPNTPAKSGKTVVVKDVAKPATKKTTKKTSTK